MGAERKKPVAGISFGSETSKKIDGVFWDYRSLRSAEVTNLDVKRTTWIFTEIGRFGLHFLVKGLRYDG
jgi:hypothetical protein